MLGFIIIVVFVALGGAVYNYMTVKKVEPGNERMTQIADAIRTGAGAFLRYEYKIIVMVAGGIALSLTLVVTWQSAVAFILGAMMSASAGWIGMKIAVIANVRVSNTARKTKDIGATLKVAFRGGSVMGLCVGAFSLLGLGIIYFVFGELMGQISPSQLAVHTNWLGIADIPFTMTVSGYALGCSTIAMFNRVGGGIYTKAADMGADLVGKTEANIPEDDPRNPATIADNVGDNVGDVAGLGADLLESFVGAIISSVVLASYMYYLSTKTGNPLDSVLIEKLMYFPVLFASVGLLSSIIGIFTLIARKSTKNPHRELNIATWTSALLTLLATGVFTWYYFRGSDVSQIGFGLGILSPWFAAIIGILCGITIGHIAEYFTNSDFKPTRKIAMVSVEGTALTITQGLATGMRSVFAPVLILAMAIIVSNTIAGLYGVAMAAVGMLSFVTTTVSVDTYGPIADNAGGISEMAKLDHEVREITDKLDTVGNTTAAIGKGFAIGSAALAALSLFASFLYAQAGTNITADFTLVLNMINTLTLAGGLVGASLPYLFSGILIEAVSKSAGKMVHEVRRQFKEIPGILTGETPPDYTTCIEISTRGSIREMVLPAMISVFTPLLCGFIFGADFVGGLLIGTTLSAIKLALFTANAGGAWDNAKKYVEEGHLGGKGSSTHKATVIGDTVGDPLKDTVGPSLDILIKIMSVVSLIGISIFSKYNLFSLLGW